VNEKGKVHLNYVIVVAKDHEAEGDRIFVSHAKWMERTHYKQGGKALLRYSVSKSPELTNPLDPASAPTGNVIFVLDEVYETDAGVADHFEQARASWEDHSAFVDWIGKSRIIGYPAGQIFIALW
jgi:hypothetical protein